MSIEAKDVKAIVFKLFPSAENVKVYNDKRKTFRRLKFCGVVGDLKNIESTSNALHNAGIDAVVGVTTNTSWSRYSNEKLTIKFNFVQAQN